MALRHRDIVSDAENLNSKPGKGQLVKQISVTRRPALDELSNKINNVKGITKKQETTKEAKPGVKPAAKKENQKTQPVKSYSSAQLEVCQDAEVTDPQMVSEYVGDIYSYLREMEVKYPINDKFLEEHQSSPRMRTILVNWLVQVHTNFGLCLETLYMCVSILDRYLQKNADVGRDTLQLVGTAALLVACKYEEMYLPDLSDFIYICDHSFTKRQILKMEMSILINLDYSLGKPLPIHFLRRFSNLARVRGEQHNLSKYLLELVLLDHTMSSIKPSLQAAAACCLSMTILSNAICPSKVWTMQLAQNTGYKYSDFKHIIAKLAILLVNAELSKHKSVHSKYADAKYNKISIHPKLKGHLVKKLAENKG